MDRRLNSPGSVTTKGSESANLSLNWSGFRNPFQFFAALIIVLLYGTYLTIIVHIIDTESPKLIKDHFWYEMVQELEERPSLSP